jgi:hypothetical protein
MVMEIIRSAVPKPIASTLFYHYSQNNTGGSFDIDSEKGISANVIIEARSAAEADRIAEGLGLYFDGEGDCSCCGTRWTAQEDAWTDNGTLEPSLYGVNVDAYYDNPDGWGFTYYYQHDAYVHYLDGRVLGYQYPNSRIEIEEC